ncbi:MAG TPA: hypothetical protein VF619_12900 [Allosphingosinicella sp.]|jgi:hypothetical protein
MGKKAIASIAALSMSLLWSGTALAGDSAAPKTAKADDSSKRVCRNVVSSGTRLSTRTCKAKAEWDKAQDRAQRHVRELQTDWSQRDGGENGSGLASPN